MKPGISLGDEKNERRRRTIILAIIMLIQLAIMSYWETQKVNYGVDELYSMGYASNYTGQGDKARYITMSPEWRFNEWVQNSRYKHYLLLSEEEKLSRVGFPEAIRLLLVKRTYFGLLNLSESIFSVNQLSAWPGVILNFVLFILTEMALWFLLKKLKMKELTRYLALLTFGLSGFMISWTLYVRFYIFVILFQMLILNLTVNFLNESSFGKNALQMLGIIFITYFSLKESELTVVFVGALLGVMTVGLFFRKEWKKLLLFLIALVVFFIYLVTKTDYIKALLNPDAYTGSYQVKGTAQGLRNGTFDQVKQYLVWARDSINVFFFENRIVPMIIGAAVMACILWKRIGDLRAKKEEVRYFRNGYVLAQDILIMVGSLCFVVAAFLKDVHSLWIYIFSGVACLILYEIFERIEKSKEQREKGIQEKQNGGQMLPIILLFTTIIYMVFASLALYHATRYSCYAFISIIILFWYAMDKLMAKHFSAKQVKALYFVFFCCMGISTFSLFSGRQIETIYENERGMMAEIHKNRDLPVILHGSINDGVVSRHEVYDCVSKMSDETLIFAVDRNSEEQVAIDFPEKFLLWANEARSAESMIERIENAGFCIKTVGWDYCSQVYLCERIQ